MRIWKWTLGVTDRQSVQMPRGAKLLTVQSQGDMPQLWALCDETAPKEPRLIVIHGTGNLMPNEPPGDYVGTFQIHGGALVFHVFDASSNAAREAHERSAAK